MGDYCGMRLKATVKEKYRKDFEVAYEDYDFYWLGDEYVELEWISDVDRANNILGSTMSYMPNCWEEDNTVVGTTTDEYDSESGVFCTVCTSKNPDTFTEFLKNAGSLLESIEYCETYNELERYSKKYELNNGELRMVNDKFIDYKGHLYND